MQSIVFVSYSCKAIEHFFYPLVSEKPGDQLLPSNILWFFTPCIYSTYRLVGFISSSDTFSVGYISHQLLCFPYTLFYYPTTTKKKLFKKQNRPFSFHNTLMISLGFEERAQHVLSKVFSPQSWKNKHCILYMVL